MKLIGSLVITAVIVASLWGIALLQLPSAIAQPNTLIESLEAENVEAGSAEEKNTKVAMVHPEVHQLKLVAKKLNTSEPSKPVLASFLTIGSTDIVGVTERIALNNIDQLWQKFNGKKLLHSRLSEQPKKIFVYYRNFNRDYQEADVSIGYKADIVKPSSSFVTITSGKYQTLLPKAFYTNGELAGAWQKIDFRQKVNSVLEIHYLDKKASPVASKLLVHYK